MSFRCDWLRLTDGRRLTYSETGPKDGIPVVYCHGAIGTPLGRSVDMEAITAEVGVRYLAISRPGIGGSDPAAGRSLVDFAGDVRELADALAIERFSVIGVSAGGPYALAIAAKLPNRTSRVAVCSSLSPLCGLTRTPGMQRRVRVALAVLAGAPGFCARVGDVAVPVMRSHPELLSRVIAAHSAPGERQRLRQADERSAASASFLDAAAGGVRGMIEDYLTYYSGDWGFSVGDVQADVHLWHGLNDPLVPIEHALQLAITIPRCRVFFDPDEGHHFFRSRLRKVLAVLVGLEEDAGRRIATTVEAARATTVRQAGTRTQTRR